MPELIDQYGNPLVVQKATEGSYRDGPWYLPVTGGWLSQEAGSNWNWWQMGYDVVTGNTTAMVEACVSAYSQTIAMCPGDHWRLKDNNGRERVENSALTRVIRKPNSYQTISDFLLNGVRSLYLDGNAYTLGLRNNRNEIVELHLMHPRQCRAMVGETGEVFYRLGGNEVVEKFFDVDHLLVPARDVLHLRLHTPTHPLIGETPLRAAAADVAAAGMMTEQQYRFYMNQARPSYVLSTDLPLSKEQINMLRGAWDEQSGGLRTGGTPILAHGLKPQPLTMNSKDAQFAEVMKMTNEHIALAFRIPMQILGIGSTPFSSTEALMGMWRATGLGFALNHIEEAIGRFFELKGQPDEYLEFSTSSLMRSSFKERVEALAVATKGMLMAPNEARQDLELAEVAFGDQVRSQQQDVPLSYGAQLKPPSNNPPPQITPPKEFDEAELRKLFRSSHVRNAA